MSTFKKSPYTKYHGKKPKINKSLFPIPNTSLIANNTSAQSYFLASYPCNIGGLRLELSPSSGSVWYAVMVVCQGNATPNLNTGIAANPIASPESDVMLCGIASAANDIALTCKTQRKMQQGDELFVLLETPDNSVSVRGTIQFFEIV